MISESLVSTRIAGFSAYGSGAWLAFGSRHRLAGPTEAGRRSADFLARPPCFATRSRGDTVAARKSDVPLTERLATRCREVV